MKKEKIITRTVTTLSVDVLGIDSNGNVSTVNREIPVMEDRKIFPYIVATSTSDFSPARVVKVEQKEQLYGMTESKFIANAEKLPPRKDYNTEKEEG